MKKPYRKTVFITVCLLIAVGSTIAQPMNPPTLDPRRFEAWTVEYEPFRLLIETAVEEFITLNDTDLPPIAATDILIAVRSRSGQRDLYQIRYGTKADGFNVIDNIEVKWILGGTLASTIANKEKYYHIDTEIPFEALDHQPELDYLEVQSFWTHGDLELGLDRVVYLFSKSGGLVIEYGNERLGLPYGLAGFGRIGLITPVFKLGIQAPFPAIIPGYAAFTEYGENLQGGLGAYGAFKYKVLYGEMFFQSLEGGLASGTYINYVDLGGILSTSFSTPVSGINLGKNRLFKGALQIQLGAVITRVEHAKELVSGGYAFQSRPRDPSVPPEEYYTGAAVSGSGPLLRLDYASVLIDGLYPKHKGVLQYSGQSILVKYVYNLSNSLSVPVTMVSHFGDNEWTPPFAIMLGFNINLSQNL